MALFGKKKEAPRAPGGFGEMAPPDGMPNNVPMDVVQNMRQQGLSNNQIIQEMQSQGYNSQQIFDALNSSDPGNMPAGPIGGMGGFGGPQQNMPGPGNFQESMPTQMSSPSGGGDNRERIEEMAEAIIDEKWEELVKSINKIIEWKEKVEGNISKIEQEIKDKILPVVCKVPLFLYHRGA